MQLCNNIHEKIDKLESIMLNGYNHADCPLTHRFTPGVYTREIFMPAGTIITSLIHKTNHQFLILDGVVSVFSDADGEQQLSAPYVGETKAGTRRVLYIHEDCRWITIHATNISPKNNSKEEVEKAVELITKDIIEKRENPLLAGVVRNNVIKHSGNTKNILP